MGAQCNGSSGEVRGGGAIGAIISCDCQSNSVRAVREV